MRMLRIVLVLALCFVPLTAWSGEKEGKIQSLDAGERVVILDDGTKLSVPDGLALDQLKEGTEVKVSFEERDGKNVVRTIEVR